MIAKAVFFDLDGTLLDTALDLAAALNTLLQHYGKSTLDNSDIRKEVSNGAAALLKLGFGVTQESPDYPKLRQELLDLYLAKVKVHTVAFPGILPLIDKLANHGLSWGIVTNKPWTYTEPLINAFNFAPPPIAIICPDHVTQKKPHPEPLFLAVKHAKCEANEAIYVGDHVRDIECGKRAGAATIAVGYGYTSEDEDPKTWGADHYAASGEELWPIIRQYLPASFE